MCRAVATRVRDVRLKDVRIRGFGTLWHGRDVGTSGCRV